MISDIAGYVGGEREVFEKAGEHLNKEDGCAHAEEKTVLELLDTLKQPNPSFKLLYKQARSPLRLEPIKFRKNMMKMLNFKTFLNNY